MLCVLISLLLGSVSVGVWQMACRRVLKVFERVVRDVWAAGASWLLPVADSGTYHNASQILLTSPRPIQNHCDTVL